MAHVMAQACINQAYPEGTVFRLTSSGQVTTLATFYGNNGRNPAASSMPATATFTEQQDMKDHPVAAPFLKLLRRNSHYAISVLRFMGSKGGNPLTNLIEGKDHALYGTAEKGGDNTIDGGFSDYNERFFHQTAQLQ